MTYNFPTLRPIRLPVGYGLRQRLAWEGKAVFLEREAMENKSASPTMDDVLQYVSRYAEGEKKHGANAMFYFLYKEILLNRMLILEQDEKGNKAAIEHNERTINDLNRLLMEQLKK